MPLWPFKRTAQPAAYDGPPPPYADRIDPAWTPYWVTRTLTDEPGKGMGSPFSQDDARVFLRACGLTRYDPADPGDPELLERMWLWIDTHRN